MSRFFRTLGTVAAFCLAAAPAFPQESVREGTGAVLRGLDKLNAVVTDFNLPTGFRATVGSLEITMEQCRYPENNPSGDAFAFITVREEGVAEPVFRGWMVASSPALNPLDHPRYDVWVMRCTTS
ncbi:DUF2155 domain-containing protein [Cognatishimia sp. F0-27]|uniref:DUF2155 domain-containing protein n=1 Tax=Cognatishimia sp. F0-27 TaxID=2816855 RepID=UPI001D0C695B|nr:DUF2155 domain-containing protein [Cognatishimia sp. F0-27]MCC1491762.1 DUF2155 domain-containing protein [Cognatishimia sp. F0-27]